MDHPYHASSLGIFAGGGGGTERREEPEPEAEYTKQGFLDKAGQLLEVKSKASPSSSQSTFQHGGRK